MTVLYVLAAVVGLTVSLKLVLVAINYLVSPVGRVPGPILARFTDGWYLWKVSKGDFEAENLALHAKYGPVVRYGPKRYSISHLEAPKKIYGLGTRFPKSPWYSAWSSPGVWSIFADQDIDNHAQNRKLYQNTYSMSSLVTYEPFVDEASDLFLRRLRELAGADGGQLDMGHWFQCYAFDVIGLITYGRRLGFLDRGEDIGGVMGALEDHLGNYLAGAKGAGRAYVISFTKDRIVEHQSRAKLPSSWTEEAADALDSKVKKGEPFLDKFIAKHDEAPTVFTKQHVMVGLAANMVAGSDTTGITLSALLYYLLKAPACLSKLRAEIDTLTAAGQLSSPVTFKESQQIPYLQAVLKEGLRMHPATGLPLERVVPPGGVTIGGYFFPQGSIVGINCWVEHRNTKTFGSDADVFNPDRWHTADEQQLSLMNQHWIPFGLGARTCIGRHISMLEISKLLPRILQAFDFEALGTAGEENWKTRNHWFVKPTDFKVKVTRRQ